MGSVYDDPVPRNVFQNRKTERGRRRLKPNISDSWSEKAGGGEKRGGCWGKRGRLTRIYADGIERYAVLAFEGHYRNVVQSCRLDSKQSASFLLMSYLYSISTDVRFCPLYLPRKYPTGMIVPPSLRASTPGFVYFLIEVEVCPLAERL